MKVKKIISIVLLAFIAMIVVSCGSASKGSSDNNSVSNPKAFAIELTAEPSMIEPGEFSIITAKIYTGEGELIEDNRTVYFAVDNTNIANIAFTSTTKDGEAKATLNSIAGSGVVNVIAEIDGVRKTIQVNIYKSESRASVIELTAEPSTIVIGGFSIITAKVYNGSGTLIEDDRLVSFSIDNSLLGTITSNSTTKDGEAKVTFNSSGSSGIVNITASIDGVTKTITIYINKSGASSIEFESANPQVVGLKGSGQTEVSEVKFLVKDYNGQPLQDDVLVDLKLNGPNGDEYIGDIPGTKELSVYTVNGYAVVYLHSGTVPGTVTILATIDGTNLNTSSGVISIGGGFPSSKHFSTSSEQLNLEGLAYDNMQTNVNVLLADRYGNYNVLDNTTVSFYSECGAIDRTVTLDNGSGSVKFRTQLPQPYPVDLCDNMSNYYCKTEQEFIDAYWRVFGIDIKATGHYPRMGLCTLVAVVDGEEEFVDANGNGLYDNGESFVDLPDIIIDKDDDKTLNPVYEHLVVDKNNNGLFDAGNGIWDNNTRISKEHRLLITGEPTLKLSKTNIILPYGHTDTVYFNISDINFNRPSATVINDVKPGFKVTTDCPGAQLYGTLSSDFEDSSIIGSPIYSVTIVNSDPGDKGGSCSLTFEYRWHGKTYNYSLHVYQAPAPPDNGTSPNP